MKTIKMLVASLMALLGFVVLVSPAKAAQLQAIAITMGDSRPSATTSHLFTFNHTTGATIKKMTFEYCKTASGGSSCPAATSTNVLSAAKGAISGITGANWTVTNTAGVITFYDNSSTEGLTANAAISIQFNGIVNGPMSDACDATVGTDTCFVWITSYAADGVTPVDTGVGTFTLVDAVVVSAKVDPTFTFVVSPVAANTVHNDITTSVLSTSNTLPFGSLQAGTPKYAAQDLKVTTNTQGGYTVTMQMADQMHGVYAANNIDPFAAPWSAPTTWTEPTGGTPNDNTGWIGANTTDTDVTNWSGSMLGKFGAVNTANVVSQKSSSDNGLVGVIVTYALEANVFQPSDAYTGNLIYNALPTY